MFHGGLWGNWQYSVASQVRVCAPISNLLHDLQFPYIIKLELRARVACYCVASQSANALNFGFGGFQEARGSGITKAKNHYYIENDLALLDAPTEWYYDEATRELYFYPNTTGAKDTGRLRVRFHIIGNMRI
eukprot:COSAG05_NODE_954_length_6442_cov_451.572915_9_plen_132_part_00